LKILLLSVLAIAMIGLMIPSAFASGHSTETPDHIKEKLQVEKKECLNESELNTWKDGECIIPDWLPTEKINLNNMPATETPEEFNNLIVKSAYADARSEFFKEMVNLSADNPNKIFYYYETSDNMHGRVYTDSNGEKISDVSDRGASYISRNCPSDGIVGSAVSQGTTSGYVYTAIVQNGDFIDWEQGITRASAAGYCEGGGLGGCLIATAAFGSEMAPQVQQLREIRDNIVMQTESGTTFMTGFNQFYYSFSPQIADYERENPVFKEAVKVTLIPLLTSLTLLNYVDVDTEEEMLGYGIGIILLNIGMYFVAPATIILQIKRWKNKN
tara:strand:- start:182 stop:1168 length:987 start_codon:yes stop_codon:yes gene_type:complete